MYLAKDLCVIGLSCMLISAEVSAESLGQWLSQNSQKVKRYLLSLKTSDLGRKLGGVRLTNDEQVLERHLFLSARYLPEYKARVFVFREPDGKTPVAWVWVDKGGKAMPLPSCEPDKPRPDWFVWSGAVISGDSYTFSEVQPGGDVVITHCLGGALGDGLPVGKQ